MRVELLVVQLWRTQTRFLGSLVPELPVSVSLVLVVGVVVWWDMDSVVLGSNRLLGAGGGIALRSVVAGWSTWRVRHLVVRATVGLVAPPCLIRFVAQARAG